jgi:HEPN domain-containing protein
LPSPDARELAERLVSKAEQDELVLSKLLDDADVHDHVLGFHAQQAVEKRLKAVLSLREVEYRWTHSVAYLTALLEDSGIMPPACREAIEDLTPWASRARYEDTFGGALDRHALRGLIFAVRQWSQELIGPTDWLGATAALLKHFALHGGLDHLALLVERERETGVVHVTLDGSAWVGATTRLILAMLVMDLDMEGGEPLDMSKQKDILQAGPGEVVELRAGLASIAHNAPSALDAKQVLILGRLGDDYSFTWAHVTPEGVVAKDDPPDSLSKVLLGIDEIAIEPVGGGVFDKPDPDVRFSGGTTVHLTEMEVDFFKQLQQDFREKFGRDPGPDDPVFFDPDANEPRPMSDKQIAQISALAEELGATEISKRVAAQTVLSGMVEPAGSEGTDLEDQRPYEDVNPLPLLRNLDQAASLEGGIAQRCLYAAVHSWAEGHLAAPGHPDPSDTDEELHVPPFPNRDDTDGRLRAIVAEALGRFHGGEGIDAIAYACARLERRPCRGCRM